MMGFMLHFYAVPVLCLALVVGAAIGSRFPRGTRRSTMAAAILIACGAFVAVADGWHQRDFASEFHLRWTPTPEERLLAQAADQKDPVPPATPAPAVRRSPLRRHSRRRAREVRGYGSGEVPRCRSHSARAFRAGASRG